jgi:hypothetical protein
VVLLKNAVKFLNILVFILSASVVIVIFAEGVLLEWFDFVPVLMISMEVAFGIATIFNIVYFRRRKGILLLNIFSVVLIASALVTKALQWEHNILFIIFWNFYILFYYFTAVVKQIWKYPIACGERKMNGKVK